MGILLRLLTIWLQILAVGVLAMLILRLLLKAGILNPKKTKLNFWDKALLAVYELIVAVIVIEGILVILPLTLLVSIVMPHRRTFLHHQGKFWTRLFLWTIGVEVKIEGGENVPLGTAIYVQNLETYLDGAAALAVLPASYRMVFQRHLMETPFLGWLEGILGYLALEPEEIGLMHADVLEILKTLNRKESILAFAEEKVGGVEVHGGISLFALQSKLPVVPVAAVRKNTAPQVGAFFAKPFPYEITVKVGKLIQVGELIDDKLHRQKAKEKIESELRRLIA